MRLKIKDPSRPWWSLIRKLFAPTVGKASSLIYDPLTYNETRKNLLPSSHKFLGAKHLNLKKETLVHKSFEITKCITNFTLKCVSQFIIQYIYHFNTAGKKQRRKIQHERSCLSNAVYRIYKALQPSA